MRELSTIKDVIIKEAVRPKKNAIMEEKFCKKTAKETQKVARLIVPRSAE